MKPSPCSPRRSRRAVTRVRASRTSQIVDRAMMVLHRHRTRRARHGRKRMPELGKGLAGKVAEALGLAIAGGRRAPGEVLRTDDLAERFGVSRTVIREAVQTLQAKRLLRSSPRVGLTVRSVNEWHLYDPDVIR